MDRRPGLFGTQEAALDDFLNSEKFTFPALAPV
jgi:hypothetical protein